MTISLTGSLPPLQLPLATVAAKADRDAATDTATAVVALSSAGALVAPSQTAPPSTIVSLGAAPVAPVVYTQPLVDVIQVRNQLKEEPAAAKMSGLLISSLGSIRANKSPFSVAALFSQVGNLGRETTAYRNEARSMAVAGNKLSDNIKVDFEASKGTSKQWVNLTIRTKDGDDIAITVARFKGEGEGGGDSLEFTFDVTGELSEAEQNALDTLAAKLGGVADDFFRTGTAELNGLKEVDKGNIESFHIDFSNARDSKTQMMSFDYKIDEAAQTQQLTAKDISGHSIDIKTNLQGLLGKGGSSAQDSLQQYLRLIDKALTEHNTESGSRRFIMDGFSSLLGPESVAAAAKSVQTRADDIVDAFSSGLTDFKAVIQAPLHHDRNNYLQPEALNLQLEQKTQIEQVSERTLIKQTSSYELNSSRIKGRAGGEEGDLEHGNYTYKTIHMKEQTSRILDMTDDKVNNAYRESENSLDVVEKKYGHFYLEEVQTDNKQDHTLTQLRDTLADKKLQKESIDVLGLLAKDKKSLFVL